MTRTFDEWREELSNTDRVLVRLLDRRAQLAVELFERLTAVDLSLGDVVADEARLRVLLSPAHGDVVLLCLDKKGLLKIFRRIVNEEIRLARLRSED